MPKEFSIGRVEFRQGRTAVIAEAGVNHLGRLDYARSLIEGAKAAGADIVKFQTYKANRLTTKDAPRFWNWNGEIDENGSQFDSYSKLDGFGYSEYVELKKICDEVDIEFMSTPFDPDSVDLLEAVGVNGYKIASCDITNKPLIEKIASTKKPVLLSTGAANLDEIRRAVAWAKLAGCKDILIMHCTLAYPTPIEDSNLLAITEMRREFSDHLIGHSDHTLGIDVASAGTLLGSSALEKHFTFDKTLPLSADHWLSLDVADLKALVSRIRDFESALGSGVKSPLESEMLARTNARRSIVASREIRAGETIQLLDLDFKRPGSGIEPHRVSEVVGKIMLRDVPSDFLLSTADFN
jgi:sialic acid synthase SpsE